jgi:hypothetical protein
MDQDTVLIASALSRPSNPSRHDLPNDRPGMFS